MSDMTWNHLGQQSAILIKMEIDSRARIFRFNPQLGPQNHMHMCGLNG